MPFLRPLAALALFVSLLAPLPAHAFFCRGEQLVLTDGTGRAFVAEALGHAARFDRRIYETRIARYYLWQGRIGEERAWLGLDAAAFEDPSATLTGERPSLDMPFDFQPKADAVSWASPDDPSRAFSVTVKRGPYRGTWTATGCREETVQTAAGLAVARPD